MKKNNILYIGDPIESLWAALGYMPLLFIITMTMDKNSVFLKAHGIRSLVIFLLFPIINFPIGLVDNDILPMLPIIYPLYKIFAIIFTFRLLYEYYKCIKQASNNIYKKVFLLDGLFGWLFTYYIKNSFFNNW